MIFERKPARGKDLIRFWANMKTYISEHTYPKINPPDLYFDVETATLYIGSSPVGYDFLVEDGNLYYKERSV